MATIKLRRQRCISPIVTIGLIFLCLLIGCKPANSPEGVTLAFWKALAADNMHDAGTLTVDSKPISKSTAWPELKNASLKTGEIVINDKTAKVETIVTTDQPQPLIIQTFLVQEQGNWKVDYQHTLNNLRLMPLNDFFKSLEKIGGTLNKQLEQGIQQFGEQLKQQVDQFGRELEQHSRPKNTAPDNSI